MHSFIAENKISAVLDFKKAYELKPDFLAAGINVTIYIDLNYNSLAIEEIDKALEFDNTNTGLHILRGQANDSIARAKMKEQFGEQRYFSQNSDFSKHVYRNSCNDFKNAALYGSLIAGLYIIDSAPCARLSYKSDPDLIKSASENLDIIIAFHRNAFLPYLDPSTGYFQKELARGKKNDKERQAYESFKKYIQATFAKGMLRLIAGEKKEACDLLGYTYGVFTKLSIIMSFELDSNLDNKSVHYRRFDPWNFDNVCNIDFSS